MGRTPERTPPVHWAVTFSAETLDGRSDWRTGALSLDQPSGFVVLLNEDDDIEEGRHLQEEEEILVRSDF